MNNQSSLNTTGKSPIGLFRQDITDPEQLAATSVARDHLVNDLVEKLSNRGNKKSGQNHLFIGPRGIGKTHLLTLLEQQINAQDVLNKQYTLIRFPEESNRILSFADLLLGIIERLAQIEEEPVHWLNLHNKLELEEDDELISDSILPRLKHWHKQTGKVLIIMLENLDAIFTEQIKSKKDLHRIRRLLMDNSHILLIGTAPTFFPALNDIKHPLYDFFDIQVLAELDQPQILALIKAHFEWDKREDLLQQFNDLTPRLLAMHTLTGGNPRLIMMLYELIAEENLHDIITQFHLLLDRITPFYQDRIKDLSPQERALLETIALMRNQQRTPVNIAGKFRKPRQQTSVLLKRMTQAGYLSVSPNPDDKRSRLYRIKEGFFDIWLAMNGTRANRKYLPFLVDFLALWYANQQERELKRQQLSQQLEQLQLQARANAMTVLDNLSEVSAQPDEKQQAKLELAVQQLKMGETESAKSLLQQIRREPQSPANGMMIWVQEKAGQWGAIEQHADALARLEKIIKYWQSQRAGELEQVSRLFHELSLDFSRHGLHQLHIALLKESLTQARQERNQEQEISCWLKISATEKMDGKLSDALASLEKALAITKNSKNRKLEGTTLNNISLIYDARGDYETALSYLQQSLAIQQEIGDVAGLCATLFNIGHIHTQNKEMSKALDSWLKVYKLASKMQFAQALEALIQLAPSLGLAEGLQGWEELAKNMENGE